MEKRILVAKHREAILALAAEHGLADVRLFGSVARGDERIDSDIDFFVRRLPGSDPFLILSFKDKLTVLLGSRVDVITEHPLMRPRLRDNILADATPIEGKGFEEQGLFDHVRQLGEIAPDFEFGNKQGTWRREEPQI